LDTIFKIKYKVSKEEIEKYRKNKLYFDCGLLGYMASSYRKGRALGKKKQLDIIGRGRYNNYPLPRRELYIIETRDITI
jgi:hypothetical protein